MLAVLRRVAPQLSVVERDIDQDPALQRRYALEIPVLLSGENEVARRRISEAELALRLTRLGLL
jgi:Glutaredoxin-like domain (DUF836)